MFYRSTGQGTVKPQECQAVYIWVKILYIARVCLQLPCAAVTSKPYLCVNRASQAADSSTSRFTVLFLCQRQTHEQCISISYFLLPSIPLRCKISPVILVLCGAVLFSYWGTCSRLRIDCSGYPHVMFSFNASFMGRPSY